MVKILKDFRVMAVTRERSRLVPPKAMPTDRPTPLANAAIDILQVITIDVIRPVSTVDARDCIESFHFLTICSRTSISLIKYGLI